MPRRPRREFGGGLAHVTARTIRRLPLFLTERDARSLLGTLDHVTRDIASWSILAYCLMPNHFHLVVDAEVDELSLAMQRVNGLYAQRFNREHGFTGHLFQGRFGAKPIVDEAHLPGSIRYVVMNPVRAGLCARPEHWRWSSYRASLGLAPAPRFLDLERVLSCFGWDTATARDRCAASSRRSFRAPRRGLSRGQTPAVRQPQPRPTRTRTCPGNARRAV